MKRNLVLAVTVLASLMGMGLASRDWRLHTEQHIADPYDVHLRYYEQIRPVLVGANLAGGLLCSGGAVADR